MSVLPLTYSLILPVSLIKCPSRLRIKHILIAKCDLFFHFGDVKEISFYYFHNTSLSLFFFSFTLKLFILNSLAVRLTREFYSYCWDHVYKVNEWCLVDFFHRKFGLLMLLRAFFFFLRFKICILIQTLLHTFFKEI